MAATVKTIKLWRSEVENKPGVLAGTLEPLANAGADLHVVMAYRYPGNESKAAIELYPVAGKKATAAAQSAGLSAAPISVLLVEGDNKPGLGHAIAKAMSDAGINTAFLVAQTIGKRYSAVVGFETDEDTRRAAALIRKAVAGKKK
jgi:hypothetical protein